MAKGAFNMNIEVPCDVWRRVSDFFAQIVAPCKECVWGNPTSCWRSQCAAFRYRPIAKEVLSVAVTNTPRSIPEHIKVENEILEALKGFTRPIHPADIKLWTTNSRAIKSKAISRLVRRGLIIEERVDPYTRFISLPKKEN
jgi:hypothetical protein